jgi:hypothetical protein
MCLRAKSDFAENAGGNRAIAETDRISRERGAGEKGEGERGSEEP